MNKYIVTPYLNISTNWGIALLILCTTATIVWGIFIGTHKTRICWRHNIPWVIIILFLYIYFRFFCGSYAFLPHEWNFKFVDWGIVLFSLFLIDLVITEIVCLSISKKNESSFVYDSAIEHKEQDILDYSDKARIAAESLKRFDVYEHSWSIGVTGKWGAGKTSYINLILENLSPDEYDIIKFNPRGSKDITTIQEDALNLLSEKLKVYYIGLSSLFKDYINALRERANAAKRNSSYSLDDIIDEWAREFYYEGRRRVDLIRFGLYGGVNNYNWQWKGGSYGGTNFSADLNIYAIPSNEISTNSNLKQNQGYN